MPTWHAAQLPQHHLAGITSEVWVKAMKKHSALARQILRPWHGVFFIS